MNFNDIIMTLFFFFSLHFSSPTGSHGLHMSLPSLWGSTFLHGAAKVLTPPPLITFDSQEAIKSKKVTFLHSQSRSGPPTLLWLVFIDCYWTEAHHKEALGNGGEAELISGRQRTRPPPTTLRLPSHRLTFDISAGPERRISSGASFDCEVIGLTESSPPLRWCFYSGFIARCKNNIARLFMTNALRCGLHSLGSTLSEERLHSLRVQKKKIYIYMYIYTV